MYRFLNNPPSRQVRPHSAFAPSEKRAPAPSAAPAADPLIDARDDAPCDVPTNVILMGLSRYIDRTGKAETTVGREVARVPALFRDLRNGRQPGPRMRRRLVAFLQREGCHA